MEMWDFVPAVSFADYDKPLASAGTGGMCARCGRAIGLAWSKNHVLKRYCSELCRKRAERARWKAKWKARGVNKYIGSRAKGGAE